MLYCYDECVHLNKDPLSCTKYNVVLPCNINLEVFRCEECVKNKEER